MDTFETIILISIIVATVVQLTAICVLFKYCIELGMASHEMKAEVQELQAAVSILGRERKSK